MSLTDPTILQEVTDALGVGDAATYAQANVNTSNSTAERLRFARQTIYNNVTEGTDVSQIYTLVGTFIVNEGALTSALSTPMSVAAKGFNTYFMSLFGTGLKVYAKSLCVNYPASLVYSDNFRGYWRRNMGEELQTKLYHASRGVSTWGSFTADKTISLPSQLEVRIPANAQAPTVSTTISFILYVAGVATDIATITIPGTAAVGDSFLITGNTGKNQFDDVSVSSISGGAHNDTLEIWVS